MTVLAADISSHNTITSWPAFLGSVDILIVKISQGTGYVWPGAAAALAQARAAGKGVGAYHFYGGGDGAAEADYFLAHYGWRPGEVPILDWEPTKPPADPDAVAAAFSQRVRDRLGVAPLIYMNSSTARSVTWARTKAVGDGLWVAQYGANNGQPGAQPAVGSWGGFAEWQYTSAGTRPGVTGPLDLSQFFGTADQWRAYGTPAGGSVSTSIDMNAFLTAPAYTGGPQISQVLKNLDQFVAPVLRGDAPGGQDELRQEIADANTEGKSALAALAEQGAKIDALTAAVTSLAHAVANSPGMTCQGNPKAVLSALGQAASTAAAT